MIQALKKKLVENEHPVGVKKYSNWKLPPPNFAYGLPVKKDKEGVSIITRSWRVHQKSLSVIPPQDFIRINKMAIRMNATSHATNKDFRKNIDVKKKMKYDALDRHIYLPSIDFAYGLPNRPWTPIKNVINNSYGNRAENVIKKEYNMFMQDKKLVRQIIPRSTAHFMRMIETRKRQGNHEEKPLYKLNMFKNVGSKVNEGIMAFKTFYPRKTKNLDNLIDKVEKEIQQDEENEKLKENPIA